MFLPIRLAPDPILLERCSEWDFTATESFVDDLERDMIETMLTEDGIGLAANQVGFKERFIAIQLRNHQCMMMYNPVLLESSEKTSTMFEGCLSFPDRAKSVTRSNTVKVQYQNRYGDFFEKELTGIDARCFLHELDHLDGITFENKQ